MNYGKNDCYSFELLNEVVIARIITESVFN